VKARAREFSRFLAELAFAQHRDQLVLRAAALAYTTLLSIVPLLTVALVTVGRVQPERAAVVVRAIATVLPFSPTRVQATLAAFAERTAALGWIAIAISVVVTFNAFYQVEEVFNAIWGIPRRRRWQWRLVSFATVLVCGPLLLAALFSSLYWLSSRPWYLVVAPLARPLPTVLAGVVLATLYKWVPHTRVRWRAALAGAGVAAVALTVLHLGFQTYFLFAADLNVIYGSLALLLFFLCSLLLFWFAVLLGAEASWVVGHAPPPPRPADRREVVALLLTAAREGTVSAAQVGSTLGVDGTDSFDRLALPPAVIAPAADGWRLARPADTITLAELRHRIGAAPDPAWNDALTLAALLKQARPDSGSQPRLADAGNWSGIKRPGNGADGAGS
jgi:membrane protein